jgi:acyl carrier protein
MIDDIQFLLSSYISTTILKGTRGIISPEEPLISSGLIDSFNLVDLASFVEENCNVELKPSELNSKTFDSLNDLVLLIKTRQKDS